MYLRVFPLFAYVNNYTHCAECVGTTGHFSCCPWVPPSTVHWHLIRMRGVRPACFFGALFGGWFSFCCLFCRWPDCSLLRHWMFLLYFNFVDWMMSLSPWVFQPLPLHPKEHLQPAKLVPLLSLFRYTNYSWPASLSSSMFTLDLNQCHLSVLFRQRHDIS